MKLIPGFQHFLQYCTFEIYDLSEFLMDKQTILVDTYTHLQQLKEYIFDDSKKCEDCGSNLTWRQKINIYPFYEECCHIRVVTH